MKINRKGEIGFNNFGSLMWISEYRNNADIDVYFPHRDWTARHITYQQFKEGCIKCPYEPRVFGIGYIGEGKYKSVDSKKFTKVYRAWHDMIRRCYDPKFHKKCPTYIECEVCDEWLNFQTFAEWFENNYYEIEGEKMALDKDILVKGNKVYSPNTCIFVPQNINKLFTKRDESRGNFPIGVCYDKRYKKYKVQCKNKGLGYYDTPEEAFEAYKTFKEDYIKQIADQYIELIPQSLYNAMYEYEVENED